MAPRQYGVVLTHVRDMDELRRCIVSGGYDALKVVSEWGIVDGWNLERRQQVLALAPHVIVRTVTGDPSAGNHDPANRLPNPDTVEAELKDWYALKPEIM